MKIFLSYPLGQDTPTYGTDFNFLRKGLDTSFKKK
ncbi:MAG: hypothetical protein ACI93N_000139 [Flavobacteriaceae bacterium]|jgi:hypothetical protein